MLFIGALTMWFRKLAKSSRRRPAMPAVISIELLENRCLLSAFVANPGAPLPVPVPAVPGAPPTSVVPAAAPAGAPDLSTYDRTQTPFGLFGAQSPDAQFQPANYSLNMTGSRWSAMVTPNGAGYDVNVSRWAPGQMPFSANGPASTTTIFDNAPWVGVYGVFVDNEGRAVVSASHLLARFLPDGQLDTSFGNQGVLQWNVTTVYRDLPPRAADVAVLAMHETASHQYLLAFTVAGDIGTARLNLDGSIDRSFGVNGVNDTHLELGEFLATGGWQDDQGNLMIGSSFPVFMFHPGVGDFVPPSWPRGWLPNVAVRFNADGMLDRAWGFDGIAFSTQFNGAANVAQAAFNNGAGGYSIAQFDVNFSEWVVPAPPVDEPGLIAAELAAAAPVGSVAASPTATPSLAIAPTASIAPPPISSNSNANAGAADVAPLPVVQQPNTDSTVAATDAVFANPGGWIDAL